jgi:hypothetical protein
MGDVMVTAVFVTRAAITVSFGRSGEATQKSQQRLQVKNQLRRAGAPLAELDLQIACIALTHALPLAKHNIIHEKPCTITPKNCEGGTDEHLDGLAAVAAPYDPRWGDSATVIQDEHGRMIESADCGIRCPGCGICCACYRDVITADYAGVEEYDGNLKLVRGGLVKQEGGQWYRSATLRRGMSGLRAVLPAVQPTRAP